MIDNNIKNNPLPEHVAIIMDGNGRWAQRRGMNRIKGHIKGVNTIREIISASLSAGIKWLTLYAFSEENWNRPWQEVRGLMLLLLRFLQRERQNLNEHNIQIRAIGRLDKLPPDIIEELHRTVDITRNNKDLILTLALSYGGRQELVDDFIKIANMVQAGKIQPDEIDEDIIASNLYMKDMPDPDLLIRTSGEMRISNFLLWQIAYSEIYFSDCLWPDFKKKDFLAAIHEYQKRERRFGLASDDRN